MGTLNKYLNAAAVEEALDKGVAAHSQSEQNKTEIELINNEITYLKSLHEQKINITWFDGYVKSDGSFNATNAQWKRTDFISIANADKIITKGIYANLADTVGHPFAFYDINKAFISGVHVTNGAENPDITIPDGAEYLIVSNQLMYYETVEIKVFDVVTNADKGIYTAIVGVGERYGSVTDAVADAKSGDRIFVKNGIYDNEHIKAWGKDIAIIGESKLGVIIQCSESDYSNPCIEFSVGILENITFKKNNSNAGTGYVLHCEDDFQYGKNLTVKNCDFIAPTTNAVGMGMRADSKIIFKDCGFYNTANQGSALYLHDAENDSYTGIFDIDFDNCIFSNLGNYVVQLQSQEKNSSIINFGFRDCTFYCNDSVSVPFIHCKNYRDGTSTNSADFNGLINWRLKKTSKGNNFTILNVLPSYSGSKS